MKSTRVAIALFYNELVEFEPGVWEDTLIEKKVKAEEEQVYQRRMDMAFAEGFVITARFKIRSNLFQGDLKYVEWKNKKYKVNTVDVDPEAHYTIIEIGQLI